MCSRHFNLSSIISPKNLVEFKRSIIFSCIIILTSLVLILLLWNTMKCVFLVFIDNLLASSHVLSLCNSLLSAMMNPSYSFPSRSTVVSSAKSMENSSWEDFEKSFMKQIKNRGPKIEPKTVFFRRYHLNLYMFNIW